MHPSTLPVDIVERMRVRRGRLHLFESLDAARTALVVIDMQNAFLRPGAPSETPMARASAMTPRTFPRLWRQSSGVWFSTAAPTWRVLTDVPPRRVPS